MLNLRFVYNVKIRNLSSNYFNSIILLRDDGRTNIFELLSSLVEVDVDTAFAISLESGELLTGKGDLYSAMRLIRCYNDTVGTDFNAFKCVEFLNGDVSYKRLMFGFKVSIYGKRFKFYCIKNHGFYYGFEKLFGSESLKAVWFRYMYIVGKKLIFKVVFCLSRRGFLLNKILLFALEVYYADFDKDFDECGGEMYTSYLVFDIECKKFVGISNLRGINTNKIIETVGSDADVILPKLALAGKLL